MSNPNAKLNRLISFRFVFLEEGGITKKLQVEGTLAQVGNRFLGIARI